MILVISHLGFEGGICHLIALVPVHCFLITFRKTSLSPQHFINDRFKVVALMWFSVACFSVRIPEMFYLMFVHYPFKSDWMADWSPFWKELHWIDYVHFVEINMCLNQQPLLHKKNHYKMDLGHFEQSKTDCGNN